MKLWVGLTLVGGLVASGQSTGRIEGHVLSQSGEGVRKATVRLQGDSAPPGELAVAYIEISDSTGRFAFGNLPPGRYSVSASRVGYTAPRVNGISYSSITLQAGQSKTDAEIKLIQQGVISGRVTDQDGDPVVGVQVAAMHVTYNGGRRQLTPYTTMNTDDQGNFRIANVEPGRYYPVADDQRRLSSGNAYGNERRSLAAQEVEFWTFYPSAPDFSGAVAVDVGAGKEAQGINIRMLRGRTFSIRGNVDSRTGAASGMQLTLTLKPTGISVANNRMGAPAQAATGAFEFHGLLPGTYVIQGLRPAQGIQVIRNGDTVTTVSPPTSNPALSGRIEVNVTNSDVERVVLTLAPPAEITGTIRMEEGGLPALRPAQITLVDSEDAGGGQATGPVNADGTFRIQNAGFSRYWVNVGVPVGAYVKSLRFGGQDLTKAPLDLTSGAGGVLDIVLSKNAAEVTGIVRNGNGESLPGITVSIWPKTAGAFNPASVKISSTGPSGNIKMTEIPPGEYYMAAWEDVDTNLIRYPDFLARFTDQAAAVRLGESDKITTDLTMISRDKIAAEVAKLP